MSLKSTQDAARCIEQAGQRKAIEMHSFAYQRSFYSGRRMLLQNADWSSAAPERPLSTLTPQPKLIFDPSNKPHPHRCIQTCRADRVHGYNTLRIVKQFPGRAAGPQKATIKSWRTPPSSCTASSLLSCCRLLSSSSCSPPVPAHSSPRFPVESLPLGPF